MKKICVLTLILLLVLSSNKCRHIPAKTINKPKYTDLTADTVVHYLDNPSNRFTSALFDYFAEHMKYPDEARKAGVEGSVLITFQVNRDSTINFWVLDGLKKYGCAEEAERVLRLAVKANMNKMQEDMYTSRFAFSMFCEEK